MRTLLFLLWGPLGGQAWFCCNLIPVRLPSSLPGGEPTLWCQRSNERLRKGMLLFLTDYLIWWEQLGSPTGFLCTCFQQKICLLTSWTKPYTSLRHRSKELEELEISTCCSRSCPCALKCGYKSPTIRWGTWCCCVLFSNTCDCIWKWCLSCNASDSACEGSCAKVKITLHLMMS